MEETRDQAFPKGLWSLIWARVEEVLHNNITARTVESQAGLAHCLVQL